MLHTELCCYSYFWWFGYFRGPWVSFVMTGEFLVRVTKVTSRIGVSWTNGLPFCFFNPFLTQLIMSILSKGCKPDHFESHDSLKLRFTNICGLQSNFVECVSFLELNALEILALCETDLDDSIDSGNFCVTGYLSLIRKDSVTHMHGLAVYVKEGLPFAWDLSLEKSTDSYLCFDWLYFTQCLTSSSSFNSFLRLYPWFLILFHLT